MCVSFVLDTNPQAKMDIVFFFFILKNNIV